jgi:hypothetical protein
MKHFLRIGENLETFPLFMAIQRQPELWEKHRFRQTVKANSETECILLRYQTAPQEHLFRYNLAKEPKYIANDEAINDYAAFWHEANHLGLECNDTPDFEKLPEARPLVAWVMARLGAERLGRVLLAKLPPGGRVYPHDDAGLYVDYYKRVVIPIQSDAGNWSRIGDEFMMMPVGEAWIYDYKTEHEAMNESNDDRVHLFIDVKLRSEPRVVIS